MDSLLDELLVYSDEELAALKDRLEGMIRVSDSAWSAVGAALKDFKAAFSCVEDVARVAICELGRTKLAYLEYQAALKRSSRPPQMPTESLAPAPAEASPRPATLNASEIMAVIEAEIANTSPDTGHGKSQRAFGNRVLARIMEESDTLRNLEQPAASPPSPSRPEDLQSGTSDPRPTPELLG